MADLFARLQAVLADRYALERELGRGGMATVYLAQDRKHHRPVAVKVLKPELAAALGPERFLREIAIAARLNHPHILPLHDSGEAEGFLYYVMPYGEGESLRGRLMREPHLPVDEALTIAREVADALSYAHSHDVIHRDIKPENILLSSGHALVADFGIARAITAAGGDKLTSTGIGVGTPDYMSPEQAAGTGHLDGRSDIYGLGCVVYEMLAGEPPYTGPSAQAILAKRLSEPVPHLRTLRDVPEAVEQAVTKALARAPADRFATATEFAHALTAPSPTKARPRRRRFWIVVASSSAIVAFGFGVLALAPREKLAILRTLMTRKPAILHARRVVVAPFENMTGDSSLAQLGDMAADWITQGLMLTGAVEVVDARTALVTAKIVEATPRLLRTGNRALALAEETGAATVVSGRYYHDGDTLRFQTQITDAASGQLLGAAGPVSGRATAPMEVVERLRLHTMAALAPILDTIHRSWSVNLGQPPTYEAYQEVWRAVESYFRLDTAAAFMHAAKAAAIDSSYMTPVVFASIVRANLLQFEKADSLARLAERHRKQLGPVDRAGLDYVQGGLHRSPAEVLRSAWNFVDATPGSAETLLGVAEIALYENRPRDALQALSRTDPERGLNLVVDGYWHALAWAHHELGDYRAELKDARRGLRQVPDGVRVAVAEVRALAALGRLDEVEEEATRRLDSSQSGQRVARIAVRELRAHGYPKEANRLGERLVAKLSALPADTSAQFRFGLARLCYFAERWNESYALFARLAAGDPDNVSYQHYLGVLAARRGDRREAERISKWLASLTRPFLFGEHTYARASIAALLGEREAAVELLRDAFQQGFYTPSWVHGDMDLESLRDYPPFQELVRPKG